MSGEKPSTRLTFVAPGRELVESIAQFADTDGWVQGVGYVDGAELRVATEDGETVVRLNGRFNLLSLAGPRGGPFTVTLARTSDAGVQVVGGELVLSRSAGINLSLHLAVLARGAHVPAPAVAAQSVVMPVRPASGGVTWASTAATSAQKAAREEAEHAEEHIPDAGDLVQHFAFGLCEVLTSDGERLRIRDVEGPKRIREVALSMLRVMAPTDSDGKKLFQLVRRVPGA
jgi:hypothetical protein